MKTITKSVAAALLIATIGSHALAGPHRGYLPRGSHHHYQGHAHGSDWVAPLLFLGLAGVAIGAAASQQSAPPPVYVAPPVTYVQPATTYVVPASVAPASAPANAWYFCRSAAAYYPYAQRCPEGWQLVAPTPQ